MIDRLCISLNNKCNINCKYCYFYNRQDIELNNSHQLSTDECLIIINNVIEYSRKNLNRKKFKIGFAGSGEPLLDIKTILSILEYCNQPQNAGLIDFYAITNGVAVTEEQLKTLAKYKNLIKLSFSLDGPKHIHDTFRIQQKKGVEEGTFDRVIKSIKTYTELFGEMPSINITIHKDNLKKALEYDSFMKEFEIKEVTFSRLIDAAGEVSQDELTSFIDEIESLSERSYTIRNSVAKNLNKLDCTMYGAQCGAGKTNIFYAGKEVYPCGRFMSHKEYLIGTLHDSLETIEEQLKLKVKHCPNKCFFDSVRGTL